MAMYFGRCPNCGIMLDGSTVAHEGVTHYVCKPCGLLYAPLPEGFQMPLPKRAPYPMSAPEAVDLANKMNTAKGISFIFEAAGNFISSSTDRKALIRLSTALRILAAVAHRKADDLSPSIEKFDRPI